MIFHDQCKEVGKLTTGIQLDQDLFGVCANPPVSSMRLFNSIFFNEAEQVLMLFM